MKKIISILFLCFITLAAQPFQINYSVVIENCDQTGSFEIMNGSMQEGDSFIFQPVTFPLEYASAQFLYNIFVGAEFGIPSGSLTENIDLKINMSNFWCNLSVLEEPQGVSRLFSLIIEITGQNSGYNPDNYYWFEQNKECFIKLNMDKLAFFFNLLNINDPSIIDVFYVKNESIDTVAIRKEIVDNNFIIYPKHFSLLSAGIISNTTDIRNNSNNLPVSYKLDQNYPNPFNPSTTINYSIQSEGYTKLSIYNVIGEEVKSLISEYQSAGNYNFDFNAGDLPSGLYFYTLSSGDFSQTKKMLIMK